MSLDLLPVLQSLISDRDARVTADEADLWDDAVLEGLETAGLLTSGDPLSSVDCRACHGVHDVEVQQEGTGKDARFWHHCPEAGRVEITAERLRQWRANLAAVTSLIQKALGKRARRHVVRSDRVWLWTGGIIGGKPKTVYWVRGHDWADGGEIAAFVKATKETVVLVSDPPVEAPESLRAGRVVSLWQVVDVNEEDQVLVCPERLAEAVTGSPATKLLPREASHRRRGGRDEAIAALTNALIAVILRTQNQLRHQGKVDATALSGFKPIQKQELGRLAGITVKSRVGRALDPEQERSPAGRRLQGLWLVAQDATLIMEFQAEEG